LGFKFFIFFRGVAQLVSVSALGAEGRQFESGHPDIITTFNWGVAPPMAGYLLWEQRVASSNLATPTLSRQRRDLNGKIMYYVYILKSLKDDKYYIGSTSNVVNRLSFHNSGRQRSTKCRIPFILIHSESFPTRSLAEKREKLIISYKGGEAFKKLISGV
jgi:putative endonuclease